MSFGLSALPPHFEAALRDVRAQDPRFREAAAIALAEVPAGRVEEAREGLALLLSDTLGPIRAAAAKSLGTIGDALDTELLVEAAEDPHAGVRAACVLAAAALDPTDAPWLRSFLKDEHAQVRVAALDAICRKRPDEAVGAACRLLEADHDPEVKAAACNVLGDQERGGLGAATDSVLQMLRKTLDDEPAVARCAALALIQLGEDDGQAVLVAALRDGPWRLAAIDGLGRMTSARSADALARVGERLFSSLVEKAAAGMALARRGDPRGVPILRRVLTAFRSDGRDYALAAVAELKLESLAEEVRALVRKPRGASPSALIQALSALPGADNRAALDTLRARFPELATEGEP